MSTLDAIPETVLLPLAPWVLAAEVLIVALLAGLLLGLGVLAGVAACCVWVGWEEIAE